MAERSRGANLRSGGVSLGRVGAVPVGREVVFERVTDPVQGDVTLARAGTNRREARTVRFASRVVAFTFLGDGSHVDTSDQP